MIKISSFKPNPANPRIIRDARFKKLVESLRRFPKMMELSPLVIDEENMLFRGHMRIEALKELGYKEIPDNWIKKAKDFSPEELREFMIKDNDHAGQWDWGSLANEWDQNTLLEWGFEPWNFGQIDLQAEPETVQQNIEDLQKIKEQRKKGNEAVVAKTDTEKYLVIVFASREEKATLLKELGLPEDERYVPSGGVQIIPSGSWISKFKSSAQHKSGATG